MLGSVLNQVLLHQSVIGLETMAALEKYHIKPDTIIGCAGGGSNLGGLISPFVGQMLRGEADYRIIAVEPASCPSLTRGVFRYDFCDTGKICPMAKMYTCLLYTSNDLIARHPMDGVRFTKPVRAVDDIKFLTCDDQQDVYKRQTSGTGLYQAPGYVQVRCRTPRTGRSGAPGIRANVLYDNAPQRSVP